LARALHTKTGGVGTRRRRNGALFASLAATALLTAAAPAHAAPITLTLDGLTGTRADVLQKVAVKGQLDPPVAGVPVTVSVKVVGAAPDAQQPDTQLSSDASGAFSMPITVKACCTYEITAAAAGSTQSTSFSVRVPHGLHDGSRGPKVRLFHHLLRDQGYYVKGNNRISNSTDLAMLAFRKVHGMHRVEKYSARIFRLLLEGRGAFQLSHKDPARHVEADLSRQVLVLVEDGKPKYTFPVSSGKPSTPTVTGTYQFYLQTPGYNAKQMYYSSYFVGGYATHGYNPVPNYPASHGCIRNPIPDARFIYNWIHVGDTIYVYH
jgi:lipoprotein-anchoring transpeptidase ErfK/SrfK